MKIYGIQDRHMLGVIIKGMKVVQEFFYQHDNQ